MLPLDSGPGITIVRRKSKPVDVNQALKSPTVGH